MLEIVKVILEVLGKALNPSEISKMQKEKKLRKLGTELFLLYTHLNEILLTGEEIIHSLEVYVSRMERHLTQGNDAYALTAGSWIDDKVVKQCISLGKFGRSVQRFTKELQVLDADSYRKLQPLLSGKMNALDSLLKVMGRGYLPVLGPSESDLRMLSEQSEDTYNFTHFEKLQVIARETQQGAISYSVDWDENIYKQIKKYLSTREPHERLEEIRNVLQQIKTVLESNFSLQDILLEIGDRRFAEGYNGEYFW